VGGLVGGGDCLGCFQPLGIALPERANGAVWGCFYRLPTSANGGRFGKCLISAAASARGAKPTWELSQIPGIV
jgi:hypothetical protein